MNLVKKMLWLSAAGLLATNVAMAAEKHKIVPEFIDGTKRVTAEEVIALVEQKPNLVILDTRKSSDFQKGYIEGAISLPDTDTNARTLSKHVASKNTPVLMYCNGIRCGRSVKSAKVAMAAGYKNIYWFRGGIEEWESKGLPVVHP